MSGPGGADRDRPLGEALAAYLRSQGHGQALVLAKVVAAWPSVVGPEIAAHAQPRALRRGTLVVAVDEPAWAAQLRFLAETVVAGLANALGDGVVQALEPTVRRSQALE